MNEASSTDREFFEQFLDDFYADCEEHLSQIRNGILTLEQQLQSGSISPETVHQLYRSFHTIKGLSAMIGLDPAEQVAHTLENLLAKLRKEPTRLNLKSIEAIELAAQQLSQILDQHKNHQPLPETETVLQPVQQAVAEAEATPTPVQPPASSLPPEVASELPSGLHPLVLEALQQGVSLYRFIFRPTPERARQGITATKIRMRLSEIGRLLHISPKPDPETQIAFHFYVLTDLAPTEWQPLKNQGVEWTLLLKAESTEPSRSPSKPPLSTPIRPPHLEPTAEKKSPTLEEPSSPISAAAQPAPPQSPPTPSLPASNLVRIPLHRLDTLLTLTGELIIAWNRVEPLRLRLEQSLDLDTRESFREICHSMTSNLRRLREELLSLRLVPIGELFERLRFAARDVARQKGRRIRFEISGQETEVDKAILDRLLDPLLHLVRNAVDHGIEPPEERRRAGKPEEGVLRLQAQSTADRIVVILEDDGRGIDLKQVEEKAHRLGILSKEEHVTLDNLLSILAAPGFSTREEADRTSGRGMGMNAVIQLVQELSGKINVDTLPGKGTRFTILLPQTLLLTTALLVETAHTLFAIPQANLKQVLSIDPTQLTRIDSMTFFIHQGQPIPWIPLAQALGLQPNRSHPEASESLPRFGLLIPMPERDVVLGVDRILSLEEIVVRPLTDPLLRTPGISGTTELGDGRTALILDLFNLLDRAFASQPPHQNPPPSHG